MDSDGVLSSPVVDIERFLRVSNEIQSENARVAYLCRFYAFERAHRLSGRGVRQHQRLEREESGEEGNTDDAHDIQAFYLHYNRNYIQALQNADKVDRSRLTKVYETANVLFEVLNAVSLEDSVEVPHEILEMQPHNILRLDPESLHKRLPRHQELNHHKIPLHTIKDCTQDFNEINIIGNGGYGRVYKGILTWADHVNQPVAVKRLDVTGFQGNKEFYTELTMLSQYQHENIITLIGFCDDNKEMILVYEYASRGSLDTYLRDNTLPNGLSWTQLLNICIDVASALDYLHNHVAEKHRIIHRDIKSANVLLDGNWNAKLSDFGLARIGLANQENTFVITNLAGTHGYSDPQYERTGFLSKESDVYSFGVVLFEVLCRRLACVFGYHDERRFLHHLARIRYKNGELGNIIDQRIKKDIKPKALIKFSAIAYQCLQETREERPTIAEVAFQLKEARKIQLDEDEDEER